jgi:acetyltransferase
MQHIFYPRRIVVIGVSERPGNLARNIIINLSNFGYRGPLYAVGRQAGSILDVPIVTCLEELPDGIDLAVILTPAAAVPDLMEACGRKGIHRVVIESAGFGEFSAEGRRLEEQLKRVACQWSIRFVGPNCISVVNLEKGVCLPFASISPCGSRLGTASVVAQSGGVSITYLVQLSSSGVGVNKVVSIGNKADLNETDYVMYLLNDPGADRFPLPRILRRQAAVDGLARSSAKPIIVHKSNRSQASQTIALSHTAALAADDRIASASLRQAGLLRTESFEDTVSVARGLALPPVRGNDLVIISRSGGHAVIAADVAEQHGFHLAPLSDGFAQAVRAFNGADVIAPTNPVDLGTIFDFDLYARIVEECLQTLSPDAILLINTYSINEAEGAHRLIRRVERIVHESGRPIAQCIYTQGDDRQVLQQQIGSPLLVSSKRCVGWLLQGTYRRQVRHCDRLPSTGAAEVRSLLSNAGMFAADRALPLCQAYGIPSAPWQVASDPNEAVHAAERLGYPVALKALSPDVIHKSDVGGVILGLANASSVRREAEAMLARLALPVKLMVQRMVGDGR